MRKLGGIAASLVLTCLCFIGLTTPAQAATPPSLKICNSTASVNTIKVWTSTNAGEWLPYALGKGDCRTWPNDPELLVDVDPEEYYTSSSQDVDSYYIGVEGQGYGPCHNSENNASNPPNVTPLYVKYNTNVSGC